MSSQIRIPFNKPYMTGKELFNIAQAHFTGHLSGDGHFTKMCHAWIEKHTGTRKALLTHSCTAALEMCALLLKLHPGDEIIMPSYTFVSTANAFVLRGAIPVFVDIRIDTGNINEQLIEEAITKRTKAIVLVHYAGVACEMEQIMSIANRHEIPVIEDAAQAIMSFYNGKALGSIGHLGTYSFHETKNVTSGEGGALLINDVSQIQFAEIIREKGTDRSQFLSGFIDKYTWQSIGSSFLPGELMAAFLQAQLEEAKSITDQRIRIWEYYFDALERLDRIGVLRRPIVPSYSQHNAHMFYILVENDLVRSELLQRFQLAGIGAIFHYIPLHDSPAGMQYGRKCGTLKITNQFANRLIRLPLWLGISDEELSEVISVISNYFGY